MASGLHVRSVEAIEGVMEVGAMQKLFEAVARERRMQEQRHEIKELRGEVETLRCTRGSYHVESVLGLYRQSNGRWVHTIDPNAGIAYVRVREILPDTPEHLRGTFRHLNRLRVLVLDLRGNPGGDLSAAVELCDMLLSGGRIVTLTNRRGEAEHRNAQSHGTISRDIRVVRKINAVRTEGCLNRFCLGFLSCLPFLEKRNGLLLE